MHNSRSTVTYMSISIKAFCRSCWWGRRTFSLRASVNGHFHTQMAFDTDKHTSVCSFLCMYAYMQLRWGFMFIGCLITHMVSLAAQNMQMRHKTAPPHSFPIIQTNYSYILVTCITRRRPSSPHQREPHPFIQSTHLSTFKIL